MKKAIVITIILIMSFIGTAIGDIGQSLFDDQYSVKIYMADGTKKVYRHVKILEYRYEDIIVFRTNNDKQIAIPINNSSTVILEEEEWDN